MSTRDNRRVAFARASAPEMLVLVRRANLNISDTRTDTTPLSPRIFRGQEMSSLDAATVCSDGPHWFQLPGGLEDASPSLNRLLESQQMLVSILACEGPSHRLVAAAPDAQ